MLRVSNHEFYRVGPRRSLVTGNIMNNDPNDALIKTLFDMEDND